MDTKRFTDRLRMVVAYAREHARERHHEYLGTEHLLLGVLQEGHSSVAKVLKPWESNLRMLINDMVKPGPSAFNPFGILPMTPRTRQVVNLAEEEAARLGHIYLTVDHLVIGMLLEAEGIAAKALIECGFTIDKLRALIWRTPPAMMAATAGAVEGISVNDQDHPHYFPRKVVKPAAEVEKQYALPPGYLTRRPIVLLRKELYDRIVGALESASSEVNEDGDEHNVESVCELLKDLRTCAKVVEL